MNDSTIVEILLGVLSVVVGVTSYLGAQRANTAQALAAEADIDSKAYDRARVIYESAIDALEEHVHRLREQTTILDGQISQLQRSNVELRTQVTELQVANTRLESELRMLKEGHSHD